MIRRSERLIEQSGMLYRYSRVHVLGFCVYVNQIELGRVPVPRVELREAGPRFASMNEVRGACGEPPAAASQEGGAK